MPVFEFSMGDPVCKQLNDRREALESRYASAKQRYWALRRAYAATAAAARLSVQLGVAAPDIPPEAPIVDARLLAQATLDEFHVVCAHMSARIGGGVRIGGTVEREVPPGPTESDIRDWTAVPH